jgi:hypothetical protein
MGSFPTKTSFSFQKFISICSEGAPKDNDKKQGKQHLVNFWKNGLKGLFDSPKP